MIKTRSFTIFISGFWVVSLIVFLSSSSYALPYNGLDIKIRASIAETYDDNLTFAKVDKKEDFITTLGLNLGAQYKGKRRSLALNGRVNKRFHSRFDKIKSSSGSISLNFSNEFSEYDTIRLSDTFSHSRTPAGFEEEFGRVRGRRESFSNSFNLSYQRAISKYFKINSSYRNVQNFFPDENRDDSSQNRVDLRLNYLPGASTVFSLLYRYGRNNFDRTTRTAGVGIKRYIIKRIFFNGDMGVTGSALGNDNKRTKVYVNVSLTDEIDGNSVAKILFSRNEQFVSEGGDIFSNWRITGKITRQLLERLNGSFSVFYGQGTFSSSDITNTLLGADLALSYAFFEDFTGRFSYAYSDYDSTNKNTGYIRNRVSLNLNKTF